MNWKLSKDGLIASRTTGAGCESMLVNALPTDAVLIPYISSQAELNADLALSKVDAITAVKLFHASTIDTLTGSEQMLEVSSWTGQMTMAKEILEGKPNSFYTNALFKGRALILGNSELDPVNQTTFAQVVKIKSEAYWFVVGLAGAVKKKALIDIAAAIDVAAVNTAVTAAKVTANSAMAAAMAALSTIPK